MTTTNWWQCSDSRFGGVLHGELEALFGYRVGMDLYVDDDGCGRVPVQMGLSRDNSGCCWVKRCQALKENSC